MALEVVTRAPSLLRDGADGITLDLREASPARETSTRRSVAILIVAYNAGPVLVDCVRAARDTTTDYDVDLVVVNNGARGPEIDEVARLGARVITPADGNIGFGAGCNLAARESIGEFVFLLNPDAIPRPGWLAPLLGRIEEPGVGSVQALLCLADRPDSVNAAGCVIHITGSAWMDRFGSAVASEPQSRDVTYACGAATLMRRTLFEDLHGFSDEYFIYHDDLELGWRMRLRGLRSVLEPASRIDHVYEFSRNSTKYYYIERNRMMFLATSYPLTLLLLAAPVLAAFEVAIVALAVKEGWFAELTRGWRWCFANRRIIAKRRHEVLGSSVVSTQDMASWLTPVLDPYNYAMPPGARALSRALQAYWRVVRKLLRVIDPPIRTNP
jgi:GT2 family glycosyltransferase